MTRTLALLALTFAALSAHAQSGHSVVVTDTPDGFTTSAPGDTPVGDAPAVLLTRTDRGGWSLRSLSPGDVPAEVAARPFPDLPALPSVTFGRVDTGGLARSLAEHDGEIRDLVAQSARLGQTPAVTYTVAATHSADGPDPALAEALAADPALVDLEVTSDGERTEVEARFSFESVAAWSAWSARSETRARLDALRAGAERQRTALDVRNR